MMDRNISAIVWEIIRSSAGLIFLYSQNDWFGASNYLPAVKYILAAYFITSIIVTGWFVAKHRKEDAIEKAIA